MAHYAQCCYPPSINNYENINKSQFLSIAGFLCIILSIVIFDEKTPSPSLYILLPVIGTVLIIRYAHEKTWVNRLLSLPFFVGIGLVSYSAYLWHQPLFAFARIMMTGDVPKAMYLGLSVITFAIAGLSWKFVETPFRNKNAIGIRIFVSFISAVVVICLAFAAFLDIKKGVPSRLSEIEQNIAQYSKFNPASLYRSGTCFMTENQDFHNFAPSCAVGSGKDAFLLWGDSHAAAAYSGLSTVIAPLSQFNASGCPPVFGFYTSARPYCKEINDFVQKRISKFSGTVIMHADWLKYANEPDFFEKLDATAKILKAKKIRVIIIGSVPQWPPSLPEVIIRSGMLVDVPNTLRIKNRNLEKLFTIDKKVSYIAKTSNMRFINVLGSVCDTSSCQVVVHKSDGKLAPLAWDYGHLTQEGSAFIFSKFKF